MRSYTYLTEKLSKLIAERKGRVILRLDRYRFEGDNPSDPIYVYRCGPNHLMLGLLRPNGALTFTPMATDDDKVDIDRAAGLPHVGATLYAKRSRLCALCDRHLKDDTDYHNGLHAECATALGFATKESVE